MTIFKRFGFYLGGFSIGLVLLAFFLSGKKTSCDYGPNARVIKNISIKERYYSEKVQEMINSKVIDSSLIASMLKYGSVDFSKSNTKLDSCKIYFIETSIDKKDYELTIENCEKKSTILSIN